MRSFLGYSSGFSAVIAIMNTGAVLAAVVASEQRYMSVAAVYLANQRSLQRQVAIKILEKEKIKDHADLERINREITILKKVRHPNVVQLYDVSERPTCFPHSTPHLLAADD